MSARCDLSVVCTDCAFSVYDIRMGNAHRSIAHIYIKARSSNQPHFTKSELASRPDGRKVKVNMVLRVECFGEFGCFFFFLFLWFFSPFFLPSFIWNYKGKTDRFPNNRHSIYAHTPIHRELWTRAKNVINAKAHVNMIALNYYLNYNSCPAQARAFISTLHYTHKLIRSLTNRKILSTWKISANFVIVGWAWLFDGCVLMMVFEQLFNSVPVQSN